MYFKASLLVYRNSLQASAGYGDIANVVADVDGERRFCGGRRHVLVCNGEGRFCDGGMY